jgi:hypothetical protein
MNMFAAAYAGWPGIPSTDEMDDKKMKKVEMALEQVVQVDAAFNLGLRNFLESLEAHYF